LDAGLDKAKQVIKAKSPTTCNNLALLYYSQGRYAEAEPLYLQALAICEQKLGVNHPHTVKCRENLELLRAANS
jgi:tetratricopeptide (TPR) repeat protein